MTYFTAQGEDYVPRNWQNHGRLLEPDELRDIRSRIAGLHFAKEALDSFALGALYAAEALLREVELRRIAELEVQPSLTALESCKEQVAADPSSTDFFDE